MSHSSRTGPEVRRYLPGMRPHIGICRATVLARVVASRWCARHHVPAVPYHSGLMPSSPPLSIFQTFYCRHPQFFASFRPPPPAPWAHQTVFGTHRQQWFHARAVRASTLELQALWAGGGIFMEFRRLSLRKMALTGVVLTLAALRFPPLPNPTALSYHTACGDIPVISQRRG